MNRVMCVIAAALTISVQAFAQRLDGCPALGSKNAIVQFPAIDTVDRHLRDSGIGTSRDRLLDAVADVRPDIRSLAALKLARRGDKNDLPALAKALEAEQDQCTRMAIISGLATLLQSIVFDPAEHPGLKPWIAPFKPCTPAEPPVLALRLEGRRDELRHVPVVEIWVRNVTPEALAFVSTAPEELFSVTVLDAVGSRVKTRGKDFMFDQSPPTLGLTVGRAPSPLLLLPGKEVRFGNWSIGEDFELSPGGIYRVSMGGPIRYLDTTVCSNATEVQVPN
jgi:hypothetical protein